MDAREGKRDQFSCFVLSEKVCCASAAPSRPAPPTVGTTTHHSIELRWSADEPELRCSYCLQEEQGGKRFATIYSGYATHFEQKGLSPNTEYCFRLRSGNRAGSSPWSAVVKASTTKMPVTGLELHRAVQNMDIDAMHRALASGVNIDILDKFGSTALMNASSKGFATVVSALLKAGADIHGCNSAGKTSIMLASYGGHIKVMELLQEAGASLDDRDHGGQCAIHYACDGGKPSVVSYIVSQDPSMLECIDGSGWTPLMRLASFTGHLDAAKALIDAGADVNAVTQDGQSVLMAASSKAYDKFIKLLVDHGADPELKNKYGKTAADFAETFERRGVAAVLDRAVKSAAERSQKHS